jgi:hypothetical protein
MDQTESIDSQRTSASAAVRALGRALMPISGNRLRRIYFLQRSPGVDRHGGSQATILSLADQPAAHPAS